MDNEGCGFSIIIILLAILVSIAMYFNGKENGYKQGQIDVVNNIIKFQLVEKEDKTKVWEEIKIIENNK